MLEAVIENPLKIYRIEVDILDINDNAPIFQRKEVNLEISELTPLGMILPLQSAVDPDTGTNSVRFYQLSPNQHFTLKSQSDGGQAGIPELELQRNLDREQEPNLELTLTAFDGGNPKKFGTAQIKITVIDVNDNAPVCEQSIYHITIAENTPKGTLIVKVTAVDRDEGLNGDVIYSFSDHTPDNIREAFTLDKATGEIRLTGIVDFEESDRYHISVQAKDRGPHSVAVYCNVLSLMDNVPVSTFISINAVNGVIFARQSFDFEQITSFEVHVKVTDAGSPPLSSNVTVNVIVVDQNDNAPVIVSPLPVEGTAVEETIPRSADPGYLVTKVTATDADSGTNAKLSYQLHLSSDESLFTVAQETGEIWTIRHFTRKDSHRTKIVILQFRYDPVMNDLLFLKLHDSAASMIDVKTGTCVAAEHKKALISRSKDTDCK
eukprot:g42062.t1